METTEFVSRKNEMADALVSLGMDRAAEILAEWVATLRDVDEAYRDGAEDALITLIQAGATDPGQ